MGIQMSYSAVLKLNARNQTTLLVLSANMTAQQITSRSMLCRKRGSSGASKSAPINSTASSTWPHHSQHVPDARHTSRQNQWQRVPQVTPTNLVRFECGTGCSKRGLADVCCNKVASGGAPCSNDAYSGCDDIAAAAAHLNTPGASAAAMIMCNIAGCRSKRPLTVRLSHRSHCTHSFGGVVQVLLKCNRASANAKLSCVMQLYQRCTSHSAGRP